jgi:SpoVK/Ycf46/Vps4 family AAA+-type ATPase
MSAAVERAVMDAVAAYKHKDVWKKWGLDHLRPQGNCILLHGWPGCGKTHIAEWLALVIKKTGLKELNFAEFGSNVPGENARNIRKMFREAKENGNMTLFLDECDAVLWHRRLIGPNNTWMLEIIDEILVQIGKYAGLVILATNNKGMLDPALFRRLIADIFVDIPDQLARKQLWASKIPAKYPLKFTPAMLNAISAIEVTGAEIETIIAKVSSRAINEEREPTFDDFCASTNEIAKLGAESRKPAQP